MDGSKHSMNSMPSPFCECNVLLLCCACFPHKCFDCIAVFLRICQPCLCEHCNIVTQCILASSLTAKIQCMQGDSVFCNVQTGSNKMGLLTELESVIRKVCRINTAER
jgi:hypothetical protein